MISSRELEKVSVRHPIMNKLEVLQKVVYFCVLTISLSIFVRQVVSCLTRYFHFDTSISMDVQSTGITEFPAFTVCPNFNVAYKGGLLGTYGLTKAQIRNMQFPSNLKMSSEDFFELVTYDMEELVANVFVSTNSKLTGTNKTLFSLYNEAYEGKKISSLPESYSVRYLPLTYNNWKNQSYLLLGRCYTYTVPMWMRQLKVRKK
jgi:hypothetical protein